MNFLIGRITKIAFSKFIYEWKFPHSICRTFSSVNEFKSVLDQLPPNRVNKLHEYHELLCRICDSGRMEDIESSYLQKRSLNINFIKSIEKVKQLIGLWNEQATLQRNIQETQEMLKEFTEENEITELQESLSQYIIKKMQMDNLMVKELLSHNPRVFLNAIMNESTSSDSIISVDADQFDNCDISLEIYASAGGQEAMLFAQELLEMYQHFIQEHRPHWSASVSRIDSSDLDGIRSGQLDIFGAGVFGEMKFEGGVHRVQRVPITSKQNKIHTSTVSVAIMPIPKEVTIEIKPADLRIETFRSSGPGGQHVQKTDSAVRVHHIPSGITAACQDSRAQHVNRQTAIDQILVQLQQREMMRKLEKEQAQRRVQIGTGERSDKIRTYNYQQDRVTDHRIHRTWNSVSMFMIEGVGLQEAIHELQQFSLAERLDQFIDDLPMNLFKFYLSFIWWDGGIGSVNRSKRLPYIRPICFFESTQAIDRQWFSVGKILWMVYAVFVAHRCLRKTNKQVE